MLRWASGPGRLAFTSRTMDILAVPPSYLKDGSFQPPTASSTAAKRESQLKHSTQPYVQKRMMRGTFL